MKSFLGNFLDRIFVVLGAFLFMQFPLILQTYQLQLTGHVNELHWQMTTMQADALKSGKSLDQYIQKFIENSDKDFSNQGKVMKRIQKRWDTLSTSLQKLNQASIISKPFFFLIYLQWDILRSTAKSFQPGLTFNVEGLAYALLGMLIGYICFFILSMLWNRFLKRA